MDTRLKQKVPRMKRKFFAYLFSYSFANWTRPMSTDYVIYCVISILFRSVLWLLKRRWVIKVIKTECSS